MRIQSMSPSPVKSFTSSLIVLLSESPIDPNDTQLGYYLISTWAKIGQALGMEFEPYLPLVMPSILEAASAKTDISVYGRLHFV